MSEILHKNSNTMLENSIITHIEEGDYGYDSILSDKVRNCDRDVSAFFNKDDMGAEEYDNNKSVGNDWELDQWTPIDDDKYVPGPPMNDCYNERYISKPRVASCFENISQCFFK